MNMSRLFGFMVVLTAGSALAQAPKPITPEPAPAKPPALAQPEKPAASAPEIAALILAGEEGTLSSQMAGRISSI